MSDCKARRDFLLHAAGALAGAAVFKVSSRMAAQERGRGTTMSTNTSTTIQQFGLIKKRPDIPLEQFHYHWREIHGPLGLSALAFKRYVQNHSFFSHHLPGFERAPFDGASESWYDTLEDALNVRQSEGFAKVVRPDMPNFINASGTVALNTRGYVVLAGPSLPKDAFLVKALLLLRRRPGMRVAEFQDYWLNVNGPLAAKTPGLLQHVQCHVAPETYDKSDPPFDGVAELWWSDFKTFEQSWSSPQMRNGLLRDLRSILDEQASAGMLVYEVRML